MSYRRIVRPCACVSSWGAGLHEVPTEQQLCSGLIEKPPSQGRAPPPVFHRSPGQFYWLRRRKYPLNGFAVLVGYTPCAPSMSGRVQKAASPLVGCKASNRCRTTRKLAPMPVNQRPFTISGAGGNGDSRLVSRLTVLRQTTLPVSWLAGPTSLHVRGHPKITRSSIKATLPRLNQRPQQGMMPRRAGAHVLPELLAGA